MNLNISREKIIQELNLGSLPPEEQEAVIKGATEHFGKLVARIMVARLTPQQFEKFKQALVITDEEQQQAEIIAIAAEVPGLSEEIEVRLKEEYDLMKQVASEK
jgi:hypothetical protein